MTPHEEVQALHEQGLSYYAISKRTGIPYSTVRRWANPEYAAEQRAKPLAWKHRNKERRRDYDREYGRSIAGKCQDCGGRMGFGQKQNGICMDCRSARREARWHLIQDMWLAGHTYDEIRAVTGQPQGTLCVEIYRMREAGWDMPKRRPFGGWAEEVAA